ncbi:MAG: oligosaccharide flippase family protein [Ignisphaera sp.]|nr:oligosaccharide flippase family protein [Ignisphaera sp.]
MTGSESYEYATLKHLESAARGSFVLFIGEFTYNLILALGSIVIARILTSEGYGAFSLALVPPLTLVTLLSFGIDTAASRYSQLFYAKNSEGMVKAVIKASLLTKIALGVIGSTLCFILAEPLVSLLINRPDLAFYVRVTAIVVLLQSTYSLMLSIFVGLEKVMGAALTKIVYSIVKTAASLCLLLLLQLGVLGALLGNVAGYVSALAVAFLFLVWILRGFSKGNGNGMSVSVVAKDMLRYGLPLYVASLIPMLVSNIYQNALLAYNLSNREVGGYRAMANLCVLITVVTTPISATLLPLFTKVCDNKNELNKIVHLANKYVTIIVIPVTVFAMIFSREILYLFYGADYIFASPFLPLLLAPNLLAGLGSITIPALFNAIGDTKVNMYSTILSSIVFIPLSYVLTVSAKLWGFLTASLISSVAGLLFLLNYVKRYVAKPVSYNHVFKTYIASILSVIPTLLVFLIPIPKFVSILRVLTGFIIFLTFYILIALIVKALNEDDITFIVNAFKGFPIISTVIALIGGYAKTIAKFISERS